MRGLFSASYLNHHRKGIAMYYSLFGLHAYSTAAIVKPMHITTQRTRVVHSEMLFDAYTLSTTAIAH